MRLGPTISILFAIPILLVTSNAAVAEPLAEKFLISGKLTEGEQACLAHLERNPEDDQARFGLGAIQFFLTFEHAGTSLYDHGLRAGRGFPMVPRDIRRLLPPNPAPEEVSYEDIREILKRALKDLAKTDATLAKISDPKVKLPLHAAKMKVDLFGLDIPISARFVVGQVSVDVPDEAVESFVITFDRGDVDWLRGYCHFLSGLCEAALAVDAQELFECTAHVFFDKVDTPHQFLMERERFTDNWGWFSRPLFSDAIAFIHLLRFPMKEPERMERSLEHFEATLSFSRKMWAHYQIETDDENEWIPNPRQTGAFRVRVTDKMVTTWLKTVDESEAILKGKKLIPFWRGDNETRGVNLRRVFTEPRLIDPILWIQGTGATPYLEEGEITDLARGATIREINQTFGGMNFFAFAFWFN